LGRLSPACRQSLEVEERMLRLSGIRAHSHEVTLQAEGQIGAEWVALLEEECRELLGEDQHVSLDPGKVSYLDQRAVKLLHDLAGRPVSIVNCSLLVAELSPDGISRRGEPPLH
jgi:hypothetical protein